MNITFQSGAETVSVRVSAAAGGLTVTVGDRAFVVTEAELRGGELRLTLNGERLIVPVAADGPRRWVALGGDVHLLTVPQAQPRARRAGPAGPAHDALEAQMPGVVRQVLVQAGDDVARGQALVVLEAMKMEIRVAAPHAGRVGQVAVRAGDTVQRGQLLVDLVAAGSS